MGNTSYTNTVMQSLQEKRVVDCIESCAEIKHQQNSQVLAISTMEVVENSKQGCLSAVPHSVCRLELVKEAVPIQQ